MEGRKLEAQGSALILPTRPGPSTHACLGAPGGAPCPPAHLPQGFPGAEPALQRCPDLLCASALDQSLDRPPFLRSESLQVWKGGCPAPTSAASALGEVISCSQLLHEKNLSPGWTGKAQPRARLPGEDVSNSGSSVPSAGAPRG